MRCRRSTRTRKRKSCRGCAASCGSGRRSSCRTGSRPSAMLTRSLCSRTAAWPNAGRTTSSSRVADSTRDSIVSSCWKRSCKRVEKPWPVASCQLPVSSCTGTRSWKGLLATGDRLLVTDRFMSLHEEEILGKAYDARLMRRLLAYLRPYRGQVIVALLLIFATGAVELAGPYLTRLAIDTAMVPGKPEALPPIVALFVGALALGFALRYAQNYIMQVIGQNVMFDMRLQIFSHLQYQSLGYFDRNPVGRLI